MSSQKLFLPLLTLLLGAQVLSAQCINDDCGDIFSDWALLSAETTVCEGAVFEVANQTLMPDIDFYVWDWGNGERDTVYEVSNHFYSYEFAETTACATDNDFTIYYISLEIYRYCDAGMSCHTQIAPVAVRFKPRANFSAPPVVCAGESVSFTDLSCNANTYEWIFGDGASATDVNPEHVFDSTGVYDVTLIATNSCGSDTLTQTVQVRNKPLAAGGISASSSVMGCSPLTVGFENESENAETFEWVFPDEAVVVFQDTFTQHSPAPVVQFTNPGTYTVRLIAANDCGDNEWTTTVEVLAPPQVNLFPLPPACDSASIALGDFFQYGGAIDGFSWSVSGPAGATLPSAPDPVLSLTSPGSYTIAVAAGSAHCPTARDSTVLLIQTPEALTLTPPTTEALCAASDPVTFTATPVGGTWSGPGIDALGVFDPSVAGVGEHTLQYVYNSGACDLEGTINISVLDAPPIDTPDSVATCQDGAPVQLDFSPAGGSWSGPGIIDATQGVFDPLESGPGTFNLAYTVASDNGCMLKRWTPVAVQALPTLQLPDTTAFCVDQTTLNLNEALSPTMSPAGGQLTWSGAGITDSVQGVFTHAGSEGVYPVQLHYELGFCATEVPTFLNIIDPETATVGPDQLVCLSEATVTLTGAPSGGRWSGPGLVDEYSGIVDLEAAGGGEHLYSYVLAGGTSCEVMDELLVTIVVPDMLDAGPDQAFCAGEGEITLPAAYPPGGTWSGPALTSAANGSITLDQLAGDATYWYTYGISDPSGCTFTDSVAVRVDPIPTAAFILPDYSCAEQTLQFMTTAENGVTYGWSFGDGQSANGAAVTHTFPGPGAYSIELTATNEAGCSHSESRELAIATPPLPAFDLLTPEGCGPLEVAFSDESVGNDLSYHWDFGNGETSTAAEPPAVVYAAGIFDTSYVVRLALSNDCGQRTRTDTVRVRTAPTADFGTNVNSGCGPLEVALANTTVGSAASYYWDFGNGQSSTDSLPAPPVFQGLSDTAATSYTLTMVAGNACGADTVRREVTVVPADVTAFFNTDQLEGCTPLTVNLTSYSSYGTSISWQFSDGETASGGAVSHTFAEAGTHTIQQVATNACGADTTAIAVEAFPAPEVAFDHPSDACAQQGVTFENLSGPFQTILWDFGDGQTSSAAAPTHAYAEPGTYTVTLNLTHSAYACPASLSSQVTVLPPPEVSLSLDASSGCPPLEVCFSSEAEGATFLEWQFGDGNSSTNVNPCHDFTEPGQYRVTLRGADERGCYSPSDTAQVTVFPEPEAAFVAPDDLYCGTPRELAFANSSTGAVHYEWNLGNGLESELTSPAATYTAPGVYTVQLRAENTFGCWDETSALFRIAEQPLADFAPLLEGPCVPQTVVFDNASLDADEFYWDFGNGQTTTEPNPVLTYEEAGTYNVTLVVGNQGLCYDSVTLHGSVEVLPRPTAAFSWEVPTPDYVGLVQFVNESTDAERYEWAFGNGATSTEENPLYDYAANGAWVSELVAAAANGCADTTQVSVEPETMYGMYFPNAFSPESGEGKVRLFEPAGVGLRAWTLEVYSPWGERVFVDDKLNGDRPDVAWDGVYRDRILPQGAYAYKATVEYVNGINKVYTGSVTLLR